VDEVEHSRIHKFRHLDIHLVWSTTDCELPSIYRLEGGNISPQLAPISCITA
jgi:hypothetical protein